MDESQAAFRAGRAAMTVDGNFRSRLCRDQVVRLGHRELPASVDGKKANFASFWVNAITSKPTARSSKPPRSSSPS